MNMNLAQLIHRAEKALTGNQPNVAVRYMTKALAELAK